MKYIIIYRDKQGSFHYMRNHYPTEFKNFGSPFYGDALKSSLRYCLLFFSAPLIKSKKLYEVFYGIQPYSFRIEVVE